MKKITAEACTARAELFIECIASIEGNDFVELGTEVTEQRAFVLDQLDLEVGKWLERASRIRLSSFGRTFYEVE